MPRNGSGVASAIPGTDDAVPSTTIESSKYDALVADLYALFNTAWPVTLGGTGGTSQISSWDALSAKGTDIASNSTINLTTATGPRIDITGVTTITAVTLASGSIRIARATGIFQITASANLLVNKSASVNYTTAVGDLLIFIADGSVVSVTAIGSSATTFATNAQAVTGTSTVLSVNPNNLSAVRQRRNRLVNPAMQISSVNGNTSGTSNGYVPADNWAVYRVTSAGTITTQRVQSVTPKGAKDRIRVTITAADASLAAGEYLTVTQAIVGQEIADFQYGGVSAKQAVLRFLFKGPAGTYAVALHNAANDRSYVALFTPAVANTDEIISLVIPGDTSGTWTTASTTGLTLDITLACGSTFQGTTGWQSGNILGTSGVSNGMGTISQVFEIGEAGLYLDPESTGVAPAWELPSHDEVYDGLALTPWVAYTPTFTGFGTAASVAMYSRRVGENLEVRGVFTSGTPTGVEARVSLGFNGSDGNVTSSSAMTGVNLAGSVVKSVATHAAFYALMEPSVGYLTFGIQGAGAGGLTKALGNGVVAATNVVSVQASIPISGW